MQFQNRGADITLIMLILMLVIQLYGNIQTYFIQYTHL